MAFSQKNCVFAIRESISMVNMWKTVKDSRERRKWRKRCKKIHVDNSNFIFPKPIAVVECASVCCVCLCALNRIKWYFICILHKHAQSTRSHWNSHETKISLPPNSMRLVYALCSTRAWAHTHTLTHSISWKMIIVWQKHTPYAHTKGVCYKLFHMAMLVSQMRTDLRQIFAPIPFALDF